MLVLLAGLALVLGATAVIATVLRRRGTSLAVVTYLAVPPVVLVLVIAGFAGVKVASQRPYLTAMFVGLVVGPFAAAGRHCMEETPSPTTVLALAGMA